MGDMEITFPGNKKVNALINGFEIATDQSSGDGGDGSAPAPFDLFLASIGTCAGIFAIGFLQSRKLSSQGLKINLSFERDEERHLVKKVAIRIRLPGGFPEKYTAALMKSVELCTVKRHLANPPEFELTAV